MKIPAQAPVEVQQAFREVWEVLDNLKVRNLDLGGRRVTNAGAAIEAGDCVTKAQLDKLAATPASSTVTAITLTLDGQIVSLGDPDSGGTGYRLLRVPN